MTLEYKPSRRKMKRAKSKKEGRKEGRKENVSLSKMNIDRKIFMIIYLLTFIVRPKLFLNTHLNGMV